MENYQRYSCSRTDVSGGIRMEDFPVAMAYVPWQTWNTVYDLERAMMCGTIFPELSKPFLGVRGGCR